MTVWYLEICNDAGREAAVAMEDRYIGFLGDFETRGR